MAKTIHQEVSITASPSKVYAALTDGDTFSAATGAPAKIENNAGGEVSLFGGQIAARNIELVPGKRVVQAWRAGNWEDGLYSVARFELHADGSNTKVVFKKVMRKFFTVATPIASKMIIMVSHRWVDWDLKRRKNIFCD